MTDWLSIEPIFINFNVKIPPISRLNINDPNSPRSKEKLPITKEELGELVQECIEVKKMSFVDTVLCLGLSPTTVRRICRTLKIGRYSDQIPKTLISISSQEPYGWKSVNGVLEKEPSEWQCVEMMFQFRGQGMSLNKIAAELTNRKIPTKNGGKWFAKSISQILKFNEKFLNNQPNDRRIK